MSLLACSGGSDLNLPALDGSANDDDANGGKRDATLIDLDASSPSFDSGKKKDVFVPPDEDDASFSCKRSGVSFTAPVINPPVAKTTKCTDGQISALATACAKEPESAGCATARNEAANKTCSDCLFGSKNDSSWKMIVLDPGGTPPARYNQAGCISLVSGVSGCGEQYFKLRTCMDAYCSDCATDAEEASCSKEVGPGPGSQECKSYLVSAACTDGLTSDAVGTKCFPTSTVNDAAIAKLFTDMAGVFCK